MAADMTEKKPLDYLVRGLQLLLAIIVIGTDAYGMHCQYTVALWFTPEY